MTAALEGCEWSAARPGRTLTPGKTRYPFYRRLGGPQGRSGRAENLVPTGIRFRTVQPVAQSLYRLSYPAHHENGPWIKLHEYNQTYVCQKLNGYGDNNTRKMWSSCGSTNLISYLKTPKSTFILKFFCWFIFFGGS